MEVEFVDQMVANDTNYGYLYNVSETPLKILLYCDEPKLPQESLYHVASLLFLLGYLAPSEKRGLLFMHSALVIGFLLYSMWAWNDIRAPQVFGWGFSFMILNMGQTLYSAYRMRPVTINREMEPVFNAVFEPLNVPRSVFKRLVSIEFAQTMSLHAGEAYAMCNLTKTDRLGLLIEGKVNVMSETHFLHTIQPMEFLDSPEFESSRTTVEEKFKVSVVAATTCRYIFWQRSNLEYLFVKDPYLCSIMSALIAKDITAKLYSMNHKIITEKGSNLDIRLPSLTSSLSSSLLDTSSQKSLCKKSPGTKYSRTNGGRPRTSSQGTPLLKGFSQTSLTASPELVRTHKIPTASTSLSGFSKARSQNPMALPRGLRPLRPKKSQQNEFLIQSSVPPGHYESAI